MGGGGFRAEATVNYIDANGKTQSTDKAINLSTVSADSDGSITLSGGWYYLDQSKNVSASISLSGSEDIHIILGDGYELLTPMIATNQTSTASLTIYAQSSGNNAGKITLEGDSFCSMAVMGDITINGGNILISGDTFFGAYIQSNGDITINNGDISISNSGGQAFIKSEQGSVTINNGYIDVSS